MMFALFGTFFSSRFIVSSLAKDMFLVKTTGDQRLGMKKDHKKIKPNELELKKFKEDEDNSNITSVNDSVN